MAGLDVPAAYSHPPLVECWLEVAFADTLPWDETNTAMVRSALGPEWPESWTIAGSDCAVEWRLTNLMGDRSCRLVSQGFSFGWLGHGGERYPRYESVRDGFVMVLDAVRAVIHPAAGSLAPRHWSVRYVNRIPRGTVWSGPGEWDFFSLWPSTALRGLEIDAAGSQGRWDLPLKGQRGTLSIEFRHTASDSPDEPDHLWITLTAAGNVEECETGLFDGLDRGREVIVRSFNELVSQDAKAYWGVHNR